MIWFLIIIGLIIYLLWPIIRLFVGMGRARRKVRDAFRQAAEQTRYGQYGQRQEAPRTRRRKIITKDMGEYVDFEEVSVYTHDEANQTTGANEIKFTQESQIEDAQWEDIK